MGARERVHRAIESATADADKTLSEARHADDHERLAILVDGWFRGLADALEELAIEVDLLRASGREDDGVDPPIAAAAHVREPGRSQGATEPDTEDERTDEVALAERARAARAETEAVRAEAGAQTATDTTEEE